MTLASTLDQDFVTLENIVKSDAAKFILPLAVKFLTSMAATPTKVNLVVQSAAFVSGVLSDAPTIETDILQAAATMLINIATAELSITGSVSSAVAKAA